MVELITDRLIVIPCSLDMAKSLVFHRKELGVRSPIHIPDSWPNPLLQSYLPLYIERLEKDQAEYGWGIWLLIEHTEKKIIGNVCFKGRPSKKGKVEISYYIIPEFREKGYGFEAVDTLIEWLLAKEQVKSIGAECEEKNIAAIRILEKLGMRSIGKDRKFLLWELEKE